MKDLKLADVSITEREAFFDKIIQNETHIGLRETSLTRSHTWEVYERIVTYLSRMLCISQFCVGVDTLHMPHSRKEEEMGEIRLLLFRFSF